MSSDPMLNSTGSKFQTTERGCRIIYLSCFFIIQPRFLFGRSQSPPPASHSNLPPHPSFGEGDGVRPAPLVRKPSLKRPQGGACRGATGISPGLSAGFHTLRRSFLQFYNAKFCALVFFHATNLHLPSETPILPLAPPSPSLKEGFGVRLDWQTAPQAATTPIGSGKQCMV